MPPMWLQSQSRRFPAPPEVRAHSAYPPDLEEDCALWVAAQYLLSGWNYLATGSIGHWAMPLFGQDHVFYTPSQVERT